MDLSYREIEKFYDRVRALLNLSQASLSDDMIDLPERAPLSELYAKSKIPDWKELDPERMLLFESAIVYKTASKLEFLVKQEIKKKELPTIKLEYFQRQDVKLSGKTLDEIAEDLLLGILGNEDPEFIGFLVTT